MILLTKQLQQRFSTVGSQENIPDPLVIAKFFTPTSNRTRYATEYDPSTRMFFGLVDGQETELGYFSLDELEQYKGRLGLGIERDIYFDPKKLSEIHSD